MIKVGLNKVSGAHKFTANDQWFTTQLTYAILVFEC